MMVGTLTPSSKTRSANGIALLFGRLRISFHRQTDAEPEGEPVANDDDFAAPEPDPLPGPEGRQEPDQDAAGAPADENRSLLRS